jgi:hypothetical protein
MPTEPAMTTEPAAPLEIARLCDTIEDCYEFTLSYAAKGVATEAGSDLGRQLREKLTNAAAAMRGLQSACAAAARELDRASSKSYDAFSAVLTRDAESSIAALELVLAQPIISSQLIDNLNASIHLRALLTDLFLITEILSLRQMQTKATAAE